MVERVELIQPSHEISIFAERATPASEVTSERQFEHAKNQLMDILDAPRASDAPKRLKNILDQLQPRDQRRLLHTPKAHGTPGSYDATLPLAIAAAHDAADLVGVMLARGAFVWLGDNAEAGELALTAAWWGAFYGCSRALDTLYPRNPSLQDTLRALTARVHPQTLRWLKEHGVRPEELSEPLLHAVLRDNAEEVSLLVKVGANVGQRWQPGQAHFPAVGQETPERAAPERSCSLLSLALHMRYQAAALCLLELGALPDRVWVGDNEETAALLQGDVVRAIEDGSERLVRKLLSHKAQRGPELLHAALSTCTGRAASSMYLCLYDNQVQPTTVQQAADLRRLTEQLALPSDDLKILILAQSFELDLQSRDGVAAEALRGAQRSRSESAEALRSWLISGADFRLPDGGGINMQTDMGPAGRTVTKRMLEWIRQRVRQATGGRIDTAQIRPAIGWHA